MAIETIDETRSDDNTARSDLSLVGRLYSKLSDIRFKMKRPAPAEMDEDTADKWLDGLIEAEIERVMELIRARGVSVSDVHKKLNAAVVDMRENVGESAGELRQLALLESCVADLDELEQATQRDAAA